MNGLLLNEKGKEFLINKSDFNDALKSLCNQMNLLKGIVSSEGQVFTCPVHRHQPGLYATQVAGVIIGTPDEVMCYLMTIHTSPLLKTQTNAHIGRWSGKWEFTS